MGALSEKDRPSTRPCAPRRARFHHAVGPDATRRDDALAAIGAGLDTLTCQYDTRTCGAAANSAPAHSITIHVVTDAETLGQVTGDEGRETDMAQPPATALPTKPARLVGTGILPALLLVPLLVRPASAPGFRSATYRRPRPTSNTPCLIRSAPLTPQTSSACVVLTSGQNILAGLVRAPRARRHPAHHHPDTDTPTPPKASRRCCSPAGNHYTTTARTDRDSGHRPPGVRSGI